MQVVAWFVFSPEAASSQQSVSCGRPRATKFLPVRHSMVPSVVVTSVRLPRQHWTFCQIDHNLAHSSGGHPSRSENCDQAFPDLQHKISSLYCRIHAQRDQCHDQKHHVRRLNSEALQEDEESVQEEAYQWRRRSSILLHHQGSLRCKRASNRQFVWENSSRESCASSDLLRVVTTPRNLVTETTLMKGVLMCATNHLDGVAALCATKMTKVA